MFERDHMQYQVCPRQGEDAIKGHTTKQASSCRLSDDSKAYNKDLCCGNIRGLEQLGETHVTPTTTTLMKSHTNSAINSTDTIAHGNHEIKDWSNTGALTHPS